MDDSLTWLVLNDIMISSRLKLELHFSLIAAVVAYIMWQSVGQSKDSGIFQSRLHKQLSVADHGLSTDTLDHRNKGNWRVDCQGASKGLFLGLLGLVAGIIVLIIFFVMKVSTTVLFVTFTIFTLISWSFLKENYDFRMDLFWLSTGTQVSILSLAIVFTSVGFFQLPKLSLSLHKPLHLDVLLSNFTTYGVFIYAVFGNIRRLTIDYNKL